jgi:PAS domain S-box-containing protein
MPERPIGFLHGISAEDARAHWAAIVESSQDAIISKTLSGMILSWNKAAERMYGYAAEEVVGRPITLLAPPERVEEIARILDGVRRGERIEHFETERMRKDGSRLTISLSVSPVFGADGRIVAASVIARDITASDEAKRGLADSEARLKAIIASATDAIVTVDEQRRITLFNRAAERMFGLGATEAHGQPLDRFVPELFRGSPVPSSEKTERRGTPVELARSSMTPTVARRADGTEFPMEASISPITLEGRSGHAAILRDVTDRMRAEAALLDSAAQFRNLANAVPQMVWVADPTGRLIFVNRRWEEYTGLSVGEAADPEQLRRIFHPDDYERVQSRWRRSLATGEPLEVMYRIRHAAGGSYRWFLGRAVLPREPHSPGARWYGTATDVDDQHRIQEELEDTHRRKDQFLAMLAHEIRNPLGAIANAVSILGSRGVNPAMSGWSRDVIDRQVVHLTRIVDDLLDVSRLTQGKIHLELEPVPLGAVAALAAEITRFSIEARRQRLEMHVPEEPVFVVGDMNRLAQAVGNLLGNAAKFSPEEGTIQLAVERDGNVARVRVRDFGAGIAPELLPRVFDLFVQADQTLDRSSGGLGIGLTLVRNIVEMHGGRVEAVSEGPGRGSEFVITLDAMPRGDEPKPSRRAVAPRTVPRARRILVVDDNTDSAQAIEMLLELAGHHVEVAHDGLLALDVARRLHPDVVLLDIGLPGMNGYEVARQLRSLPEFRDTVLVALTGYGQSQDRRRSEEAGFDHHLVKPVSTDALLALTGVPPEDGDGARSNPEDATS